MRSSAGLPHPLLGPSLRGGEVWENSVIIRPMKGWKMAIHRLLVYLHSHGSSSSSHGSYIFRTWSGRRLVEANASPLRVVQRVGRPVAQTLHPVW